MRRVVSKRRDQQGAHRANARPCPPPKANPKKISSDERIAAGGAANANWTPQDLRRFNSLPDDAILPSRVTAIILGLSERTVRYHPHLPRVQISRGRYGQRVRDIRRLCREGTPQEAA